MPSTDEVLVILSSSRPMPYYAPPRRDVIDERVRFVATGDKRPRSIGFRSLVIPLDDKRVLKTSINVPLKEARAMEHVRQVRGFSQHSSDAFTLGFHFEQESWDRMSVYSWLCVYEHSKDATDGEPDDVVMDFHNIMQASYPI